jgi:hypothetical protein
MNTYLGQIEQGLSKVMVYYNDYGYVLTFHSNGNQMSYCELLDADHVARELEHNNYSESFIDVILSML